MHALVVGLLLAQAGESLTRHDFKGITVRAPKPFSLFSQAISERSGEEASPVCAPQPTSVTENSFLLARPK